MFLTAACAFLAVCLSQSAMFQHAMWGYDLFGPLSIPHVLDGLFTFATLEFLSAGLFITTRKWLCHSLCQIRASCLASSTHDYHASGMWSCQQRVRVIKRHCQSGSAR